MLRTSRSSLLVGLCGGLQWRGCVGMATGWRVRGGDRSPFGHYYAYTDKLDNSKQGYFFLYVLSSCVAVPTFQCHELYLHHHGQAGGSDYVTSGLRLLNGHVSYFNISPTCFLIPHDHVVLFVVVFTIHIIIHKYSFWMGRRGKHVKRWRRLRQQSLQWLQ